MSTPSTAPRPRPSSRPTTPLRRSSRDSLRRDSTNTHLTTHSFPLDHLSPHFAELSDSLTDLDSNLQHLQLMQESMSRFCESFSAFLYGLEVNAFCVDFTEAPIQESFARAEGKEEEARREEEDQPRNRWRSDFEAEMTFLTNETSFVNEPKGAGAATPTPKRGGGRRIPRAGGTLGRGAGRGGRGGASGIARGVGRGS